MRELNKMKSIAMRKGAILAGILACTLGMANPSMAQGQLTPVITVNDRAITQYELTQRARLLEVFRTAGDLNEAARDGLIEDRLKQQEMSRFGVTLSDEALQTALNEFAARANLTLPQFLQILSQNGIDQNTLVDFVGIGILWRDYVRARFSREVTVTDADIERALARQGASPTELQVLLSEIIIGVTPQNAARAAEVADRIARIRSFDEFSTAASQASALPSRENGGRLDWLPITNYPPQLQQVLLDLAVGEVTEPIEILNGIALFQKRGQREARRASIAPVSIDYAAYYIPGGQSDAARQLAAQVRNDVDTCDDLYGVARDKPVEALDRFTVAPSEISSDVAIELARLDPGEVSTNLTRDNGETLVFLMLCARNNAGAGTSDRNVISGQIRSQRLGALAESLVEDLRASAVIRP
jgi:peptidyl-prolyl cis-trans isomerase SurA